MHQIGIIGMGYVGLCTGVCFAANGQTVVGVDVDVEKIAMLGRGETPIFEEGLADALKKAVSEKRIVFSTSHEDLREADYVFITVGTPSRRDGGLDLAQVRTATRGVGRLLARKSGFPLVVLKSTVLPGTSKKVVGPLLERLSGRRLGTDFGLCTNPEFLREGSAIKDTLHPDKVVVGAEDERSRQKLVELYNEFYGYTRPPFVHTNISTAELIKYANNSFLAMKISYINMMARLCERIEGSDVKKVAEAVGLDSRIGPKFLEAGPGYGGSCFPKDLSALINLSKRVAIKPTLLSAVKEVNDTQPDRIIDLARKLLPSLRGKTVSALGLSFKANSDDVRESPSLKVIRKLLSARAKVRVYDPRALENARKVLGEKVVYSSSLEECLKGSDLCIVLTGWEEFSELTPEDFTKLMAKPRVVDGRRVYDSKRFRDIPFTAIGLGIQLATAEKMTNQ